MSAPNPFPAPTLPAWDQALSPARFALLLALLIAAPFSDVLFGTATFFVRDYARFGYPLALHHQNSFWAGEVPLWNPWNSCGLPFLAQWNTITLYPGSLFYLLLPLSWALAVFNLLHQFLGGLGMYMLGRRVAGSNLAAAVAGLAYAFNGFVLNALMWPNYMASLGWLPWVLLVGDWAVTRGGRRLGFAGVVCAMQLLSGTPELTAMTWLVLGVLAAARWWHSQVKLRPLAGRLCVVLGLGLLLASSQLLPFVELLSHSQRGRGFASGSWSILGTGWARLILPSFYGARTSMGLVMDPGQSFTNSWYPGIVILAVASLATTSKNRFAPAGLIFLSLIALTLALGDAGQVYAFLRQTFPLFGVMRFPVKFVMLLTITIPLLAAWGIAAILTPGSQRSFAPLLRRRILGSTLLLLLLLGFLVWFERAYPILVNGELWSLSAPNGAVRGAVLLVGTGLLLLLLRGPRFKAAMFTALSLLLLLWADMMTHTPWQNPTVPRAVYEPGFAPLEELNPRPALGLSRAATSPASDVRFQMAWIPDAFQNVLLTRLGMTGNANLIDNLPKIRGFFALNLPETTEVERALFVSLNRHQTNIADFLSVSQINQLPEPIAGADTNASPPAKPFEWMARSTHLPLVTAGMAPIYRHPTNVLQTLRSEVFDPRKVVVLDEQSASPLQTTDAVDAVVVPGQFNAHRVSFTVQSTAQAVVVIGQSIYPPWKAYVDGKPVPLLRANHAFQGLVVEPGRHEVWLRYEDRTFRLGLLLSVVVLIGTVWRVAVWR